MNKEFIQVYTAYEVDKHLKESMPVKDLNKMVNSCLCKNIAAYLMENIDQLPIQKAERILDANTTEHEVRFFLISDHEISRLQHIEREYNYLIAGLTVGAIDLTNLKELEGK